MLRPRPILAAAVTALSLALAPVVAAAPPTTIYSEDFENGSGLTELESYVSDSGVAYSADSYWLNQRRCNGFILSYGDTTFPGATYCNSNAGFWAPLRRLSYALGLLNSPPNTETNRAVSSLTTGDADTTVNFDPDGPLSPMIEFRTIGQLGLPAASGRFVTFSVDAAATSCGTAPLLRFYLRSDLGTETPVSSSPINPCTDPDRQTANIAGTPISYGSFAGDASVLLAGSSFGIVLRNEAATSSGNDGSFDNIRVLDATPSLEKSFSPAVVDVGATSRLTFTVTNTDELAAKNGWSFEDALPAGLRVAGAPNATTTCGGLPPLAAPGATSVAAFGSLAAGQASCTVSLDVTAASGGTYTNCAANMSVTGLNPPGCASVRFRAADLLLNKSASPVPLVPGTQETFSLTVRNNGPDAATDIVVDDPLPDGLTVVSADGCSPVGGRLECRLASLDVGASHTFTVVTDVASSVNGDVCNAATVTSSTPDPNILSNSAFVCIPLEGRSDLSITKTASDTDLPVGGGQVTYTLVVRNDGPSDATGVTVTDPMAAGLTLVAAEPSQGSCSTTGGQLTCDVGTLAANGAAQVVVTADARASGEISNTATVSGDQLDPTPENNEASATVTVPAPPSPPEPPPAPPGPPTPPPGSPAAPEVFDLAVNKTADDREVAVGQPVRYRIAVRNDGPAEAPHVRLTDTLNAPARVVSVRTTAGSCSRRLPLACELGTIAPGATVTISVVVRHREASARQRNAASVTAAGTESEPADNLAAVDVRVRKVALRLSKGAARSAVTAGDVLGYWIRVRNPTDGVARSVRVCDRLPASGLAFARGGGRNRCWTIKRLGAGASRTFRVTVRVARGAHGRVVNRATVASENTTRRARARATIRVRGLVTPVTG